MQTNAAPLWAAAFIQPPASVDGGGKSTTGPLASVRGGACGGGEGRGGELGLAGPPGSGSLTTARLLPPGRMGSERQVAQCGGAAVITARHEKTDGDLEKREEKQ